MQLNPISLPDWKEPVPAERAGNPEWFQAEFGSNGDGFFLPNPARPREHACEVGGNE